MASPAFHRLRTGTFSVRLAVLPKGRHPADPAADPAADPPTRSSESPPFPPAADAAVAAGPDDPFGPCGDGSGGD